VIAVKGHSHLVTLASCRVNAPFPEPISRILCPGSTCITWRKVCARHSMRSSMIGSRCLQYASRARSRRAAIPLRELTDDDIIWLLLCPHPG
jgi:hypothetical protein